ncbi:hypothetical protein CQ050_17195 [Achromobacter sp. MYb9]|uniref:hypothetical protein n=1 Tax=Achromobacter sp. MYb9 TaxID=1827284 RepID=UPI000CFC14CF|nr:hypothetical protein [Achromobacter sp. MYb9]PQZ67601.1 hypothetical protein CQ050_17195 [Achromobacter sp. MYb9]
MFLPSTRGQGRALLALLFALLLPTVSQASTAKQADVQLQTDLNTMVVRVDQGAPLPPGGCVGGYAWHTTYGGCRIAQTQAEYSQCPAGYTGSQVRYRTYYVLQANANDVAYEGWGPWQDGCTASRAGGVLDVVIAKARGNETGETFDNSLGGTIAAQMQVNYGTMFGATIYRPTAELNCIHASGTTSGDTARVWMGQLMPPGTSVTKGVSGYCQLSNGNRTATLFGSCDTGSGGDADVCQGATRVVNITAVSGCTVTTETRLRGQLIDVGNYGICN